MSEERISIKEEIKVIPGWAVGLAVLVFAGLQVLFNAVLWRREPNPPPLPFQIFIGIAASSVLVFLILLIGYVNRDAKRRGMNRTLWTVLVIFIPDAIGFILYFLLRHPLMTPCPKCGTSVDRSFNFCPSCKFNLHPACPECHRAARVGDTFCPYCAHELGARA